MHVMHMRSAIMPANLHKHAYSIINSFCLSSVSGPGTQTSSTPRVAGAIQNSNTARTAGASVTVAPVTVAAPVSIIATIFIFITLFVICFVCAYKKRQASSASLVPERHTTQPAGTFQNVHNQRDLAVSTPGSTSVGANSQAINPGPPCPAYAAQDLPPDYYVVSKDNPPAYQTVIMMPSVVNPPVYHTLMPTTQ